MAVVIPSGYGQVSVQYRNTGDPDPWYITFGVDAQLLSQDDYTEVAEACGNFAYAAFGTHMVNTITQIGVQMRVGLGVGIDPLTLFFPQAAQGGTAVAKLPSNCAALIQKQTLRSGRTGKGRMFIPGFLEEGQVDTNGMIADAYRTQRQTAINSAFTTLEAGTATLPPVPMVLLHNEGAPGGVVPTPVSSLMLAPQIATQRRRMR